jgi:hypothetical protein
MRMLGIAGPLLACGVVAGGAAVAHEGSPPSDVAADIRAAGATIFDGGAGGAAATSQALTQLVEVALRIGEDGKLPASTRGQLGAVLERARQGSVLDEEAGAALRKAYAALNGGAPFSPPANVSSLEAAAAHGRAQLERGIEELQAGRPSEAARDIVGVVIFVVTPMGRR